MASRVKFFDAQGDTEGHGIRGFRREVEVEEIKLKTSEGDELTLEPEDDGETLKVTDGPDDLVGHAVKFRGLDAEDDTEGHGRRYPRSPERPDESESGEKRGGEADEGRKRFASDARLKNGIEPLAGK